MGEAEAMMPPGEPQGPPQQQPDVQLSWDDQQELLDVAAQICPDAAAAQPILQSLQFPLAQQPAWAGMTSHAWWAQVFNAFNNGIIFQPYRRLIIVLNRRYQANEVLRRLHQHYIAPAQQAAEAARGPGCHVIVRASTEDERATAFAALRSLEFEPREVWSTQHAVSYETNTTDVRAIREALSRTELGWTVVPAGEPDYLLRELIVQGPDGSRFRMTDAPAQQTFRNVATEVVGEYGPEFADAARPTVIDRVLGDGESARVNPDDTLHEAGVRDGDQLRIGFEGTAGAVNPLDRQDALHRVLNQILGYAGAHEGVTVRANSVTLPTEYEIDFVQYSFGPPATEGGEPVVVRRHTLLVQLGPEFPETAPSVFWLTPIFHPNVFPNYDSDQSRRDPHLQGLVCLGLLAESWHPAMNFGELCQMLVEMAGYRNYNLFEPTGVVGADGPQLRANFFDQTAARWALTHQDRIMEIGGKPIVPRPDVEPKGRRNVIAKLD